MRKSFIFSLALSSPVAGCGAGRAEINEPVFEDRWLASQRPLPRTTT
jgi:hypothetical protein